MTCSEARLIANRANARKSTGPKSDEGKDASRRNALKHGLTGSGVVIPGEDAAEVARESAGLMAELAPDGLPIPRLLAERVATLVVRLRRSARLEFAATADRCRAAAIDFDEVRADEAGRLFEALDEGSNRDDLLAMPEGVDLLDATLADLRAVAVRAAADPAAWSRDDSARLVRCLCPDARAHAEALGRALADGDLSGLDRGIVAVMEPGRVRTPWASDQVVGLVDAERADLAATRASLDHRSIARLRSDAISLALVDDAPETLRARRYEAASSRELYRALREIREIRECRKPAPAAAEPPPSPFEAPAELLRRAEASRRQFARVEPAPVAAAPPLASFFPAAVAVSAAGVGPKPGAEKPAARGQSRYEDRRKRPKLGR